MGLFKKMFTSLSTKTETETAASAEQIPEAAQDVVDQLKQQFPGADVQVQTVSMSGDPEAAKQVISAVEQATGQDVDGDGTIGGSGAASAVAESAGGDRISRLERLAKLHEQGVLTDAELATEKARILGS